MLRMLPPLAAALALASGVLAAPSVGGKAPELVAKELNGQTFRLSQFRGQSPMIINFFSTT
jgi:peroxiredoxin